MMSRRQWITGTALGAGVAWLTNARGLSALSARSQPPEVSFRGHLYRGTGDGRIVRSSDGGATWEVNDDFGPAYRVVALGRCEAGVFARLSFRDVSFTLRSSDAVRWYV